MGLSRVVTKVPKELRPLLKLVQRYVTACPLPPGYLERHEPFEDITKRGRAMSGQCDNGASMFKYLAGGPPLGWVQVRLTLKEWPEMESGSHYFAYHKPTGVVVDPTAEQFPTRLPIPYEKGRPATSGGERGRDPYGRRYPKQSSTGWAKGKGWLKDAGVQAVLRDPKGKKAIARAWAWAEKASGLKMPRPDPSKAKLPRGDFPGFDEGMLAHEPASEVNEVFIRSLLGSVQSARWRVLNGSVDLEEVRSLVDATRSVLRGECPPEGCIVKHKGAWRVISDETGELWPQTFETKERATDAIATYQSRKRGILPA